MTEMQRMKQLIEEMTTESRAYYLTGNPIVPDHVYDAQFDELASLEKRTGIILGGSPTQTVSESVSGDLKKVKHLEPMLSADKIHTTEEAVEFLRKNASAENTMAYLSWKEDGLTLVATYHDGRLTQLVTRGDGEYGEDVTHNAKNVVGLPSRIAAREKVVVRGECVVAIKAFNALNETLEEPFSHPRGMAVGSIRLKDPATAWKRPLHFKAFELVYPQVATKTEQWTFMENQGFDTVEHWTVNVNTVEDLIQTMNPKLYPFPVDGMVIEYDDQVYGRALGSTGHHERRKTAYKWPNEAKKTVFRRVELRPTRTGKVSLTAIFDPVEIDGSVITRATLHNLSFFQQLKLGIGDRIEIMKANMIIPAIKENLTRSGTYTLPDHCPCCGAKLRQVTPNTTSFLECPNQDCAAKKVRQYAHFVSKKGMNIVGLSESVLEKLLVAGLLNTPVDIYRLKEHEQTIAQMDGMGEVSAQKLLKAIETSRETTLPQMLTAFGIPLLGAGAAKILGTVFASPKDFAELMDSPSLVAYARLRQIPNFGHTICNAVASWWADEGNRAMFHDLEREVIVKEKTHAVPVQSAIAGKKICITGTLSKSRDDMAKYLESWGASVTGSVSSKTDYLLAGENAGSKLEKAKQFGVEILTENGLRTLLGVDAP